MSQPDATDKPLWVVNYNKTHVKQMFQKVMSGFEELSSNAF